MTPTQEELARICVAADALQMGTATYWRRRAEQFEDAKPRQGEFHGRATRADLSAAWRRCHEAAEACRHRAEIADMDRGSDQAAA